MDVKLCECGCGLPTSIATYTNKKFGHVKGQPVRFRRGHHIPTRPKLFNRPQAQKRCRDKKKQKGICRDCSNVALVGRSLCQPCIDRSHSRSAARRADRGRQGLCVGCPNRRREGKKYCQQCADQRVRERRERLTGWTPDHYEAALVEQDNRCAICQVLFTDTPHADHQHIEPPKPRGLLCEKCNWAIGLLNDSAGLCDAAAEYLRRIW